MTFVQYNSATMEVQVPFAAEDIALYVAVSADTFLLVLADNTYQYRKARANEVLLTGQLPKHFHPCQYIKPLINFTQCFVYLLDSQATLCKLDYKHNTVEIRHGVVPRDVVLGCYCLQYRMMQRDGGYLLGRIDSADNRNSVLFVYDWQTDAYSNVIVLGGSFYNVVVSNFSTNFGLDERIDAQSARKFVVMALDRNKIHYNYIEWEVVRGNKSDSSEAQPRPTIVLKQTGRKIAASNINPRACVLNFPYVYILGNETGVELARLNIDENSISKINLKMEGVNRQEALVKRYFGMVGGNVLFSVLDLKENTETMHYFAVEAVLTHLNNKNQVKSYNLLTIEKPNKTLQQSKPSAIIPSADGLSYHKFSFVSEKIAELLRKKEDPGYPSLMLVSITYRISKKFYYAEMAENLGFSASLTQEILALL